VFISKWLFTACSGVRNLTWI